MWMHVHACFDVATPLILPQVQEGRNGSENGGRGGKFFYGSWKCGVGVGERSFVSWLVNWKVGIITWKWTGKWEGDFRRGRERGMLSKLTNKKKIIWLKTHHIYYLLMYRKCLASMLQIQLFFVWWIHPKPPTFPLLRSLYSNQSLVFKIFIHNFCTNIIS